MSVFGRTTAGVADVALAFAGLDGGGGRAEMPLGVFRRAHPGVAHPMLDLCEGLLDRIEIRRVRRQSHTRAPALWIARRTTSPSTHGLVDNRALVPSLWPHCYRASMQNVRLDAPHSFRRYSGIPDSP